MSREDKWLEEILADVGLWYLTQPMRTEWVRTYGDHGVACYVKVYLEENGYEVELRKAGNWNELVIKRNK